MERSAACRRKRPASETTAAETVIANHMPGGQTWPATTFISPAKTANSNILPALV